MGAWKSHSPRLRPKEVWGLGWLSSIVSSIFLIATRDPGGKKGSSLIASVAHWGDMSLCFIVLDSILFFDLSLGVTNKEHRFKDINNSCVSHTIGIRRRGDENDGDMNKPHDYSMCRTLMILKITPTKRSKPQLITLRGV